MGSTVLWIVYRHALGRWERIWYDHAIRTMMTMTGDYYRRLRSGGKFICERERLNRCRRWGEGGIGRTGRQREDEKAGQERGRGGGGRELWKGQRKSGCDVLNFTAARRPENCKFHFWAFPLLLVG